MASQLGRSPGVLAVRDLARRVILSQRDKRPLHATHYTGSTIAVLDDTCGNLIQLTQLAWG